ncbi:hypothetical protein [Apibacter sp. HY039]|uniref:hypothetical protein n=1 Tax=Apibacter sp. HY039 TaxID=2501476 RepID=UPI000FEB7C7B|nr:hypothetical protein [Apibacter sp. HY039]
MKKIILFVILTLLIVFSICLYALGFKIPQKDIHKDWPHFPETTFSEFKTTKYDSMHIIFAFKIPNHPYMFIYYNTENIDPAQIREHPELLNNKNKIGVFDINLNPVYFKKFSNTLNKSYLFIKQDRIYELIIDEKDSLKSELYYSSISPNLSYHKKAFLFVKDTNEAFLNNHGKDLIPEESIGSRYEDKFYYFLLIDKYTDEVYAYKQLKNQEDITRKYSSLQYSDDSMDEEYPKIQLIDSIFSKNHLTTKPPLSFTPMIKSYYTYYYSLTINNKVTYFKIKALDSDFINRNFTPILVSQKKYFFLENNLAYPGERILFSISTD